MKGIAQVTRELPVTLRALRVWEAEGLLTGVGRMGGSDRRAYSEDHVERIKVILVAQMAGKSLPQIKELLVRFHTSMGKEEAAKLASQVIARVEAFSKNWGPSEAPLQYDL